jgi:hypothetical protein
MTMEAKTIYFLKASNRQICLASRLTLQFKLQIEKKTKKFLSDNLYLTLKTQNLFVFEATLQKTVHLKSRFFVASKVFLKVMSAKNLKNES